MHATFRYSRSRPARPLGALLLAALLVPAAPAAAQSVTDFRLPAGTAPRAQGPVDPDNPATPTAPTPRAPATAAPAPAPAAPSPTPTLTIPPPAVAVPASAPASQRTSSSPARAARPPAAPATAAPEPSPAPAAPSLSAPAAPPIPAAPAPIVQAPIVPTTQPSGSIPWWWLIPAALIGGFGAWALLRRRRGPAPPAFIRPRAPAEPLPEPARAAPSAPAADPADPLGIELEPLRLSVTLVNATLQYRLVLANRSPAPLGPIHIAADMIAAHASLSEQSQLGQDGQGLELRHEITSLAPGETLELKGDLRLPLASVTPIKAGPATLLIPLVRLRTEGAGPSRTTALVIGEPPASPGGPLRPFRLDQGPRIFAAVSQRALAVAA